MAGRGAGIADIRLSLGGPEHRLWAYEVAGLRLVSDLPISQLTPFTSIAGVTGAGAPAMSGGHDEGVRVYAGPGWVGGRLRQVESRSTRQGYRLKIEGAGDFEVSRDGTRVGWQQPAPSRASDDDVAAAVLGPCLVLALALRGIWCLHASAASSTGSAVALVGESGCGKSTLATALARGEPGWRSLADDLLAVKLEKGGVKALPHYPQPGAVALSRALAGGPGEVGLAVVYLLEPDAAEVGVRELTRRRAALALVRQTMAARLFDAELQARHLDFCAQAARCLPVRQLRFPRRLAALPAITTTIVAA